MTNKYDLAIFDLDGTVLNTLQDLSNAVNHALSVYNLPTLTNEQVASYTGNGIRVLIELAAGEDKTKEEVDKIFKEFKDYYSKHSSDTTAPYTNMIDMINNLKAKGIKVALLSNKIDSVVKDLESIYFKDVFEIARGEIAGVPRKPEPDVVLNIIDELNSNINSTVYIGDSEVDIITSMNANVDCIAVTWGFRTKEYLEQYSYPTLVDTVDQLFRTITR